MNLLAITYIFSGCNNEGIYAGGTARPDARPKEHITALKNDRHWNEPFQSAVNEYGLDNFKYQIIETVDFANLAEAEAKLVQQIKEAGHLLFNIREKITTPHPIGYTLSDETRRRQSQAKKFAPYAFVSPVGEVHTPAILSDLCREYKLDLGAMSNVNAGKRKSHRGWKRLDPEQQSPSTIVGGIVAETDRTIENQSSDSP